MLIVSKIGNLKGYRTTWYYPEGITYIQTLNKVKDKYCATYDSATNDGFVVHKKIVLSMYLHLLRRGCFFNISNEDTTMLVITAEENKTDYTVRHVSLAKNSCTSQNIIIKPCSKELYTASQEHNSEPPCDKTRHQ